MHRLEHALRAIDRFQRSHPSVGFPFAVFKKYGDDDGGRLGGLIAYYGFFSLFPLLLVLVSVLGFVLSGQPDLRRSIVDSALGQFPVIGRQLRAGSSIESGLPGSGIGIVVGGVTALWAGLGVAQATQAAMNTVWDIPRSQWPSFSVRQLRALTVLSLLGLIVVASTFASGYASSGNGSGLVAAFGWMIALVLNVLLFGLTYQILTARRLAWPNVIPGAVTAAVSWTVLQGVGGYYLTHQLQRASDVYGTFALVLALLVWIALGAQITLLGAEINVVRQRRLWPRALVQPPLTAGDERVYRAIVERARMRPEVGVRTWFTESHEKGARGRDGATPDDSATPPEQRSPDPNGV